MKESTVPSDTVTCTESVRAFSNTDAEDGSCNVPQEQIRSTEQSLEERKVSEEHTRAGGDGRERITTPSTATDGSKDTSEAVQLLDEELAALEQLITLERKKIGALERVRQQLISGKRELPDTRRGAWEVLGDSRESTAQPWGAALENVPDVGRRRWDSLSPTTTAFEHHMMPYARLPLAGHVVASVMLSFRLKGKSRKQSSGRSGFLTIFAYLQTDGTARLFDADGEEVLVFDTGHGPAVTPRVASTDERVTAPQVVVGMTGDASDGDPVIVTAGADGTARVHSLKVRYRGKEVGGMNKAKEKSRGDVNGKGSKGGGDSGKVDRSYSRTTKARKMKDQKAQTTPPNEDDEDSTRVRESGDDGKLSSAPRRATAMGVGVAVKFRVCLGPRCENGHMQDGKREGVDMGDDKAAHATDDNMGDEAAATITSMDAFHHRAIGKTVVIAGFSNGGVRFYHGGNGSVLGFVKTSKAVLAVKRSGQSVAFSDGGDVRFASAMKLEATPSRVCRGTGSMPSGAAEGAIVTALAFDVLSPGTLYVGYDTGEVVAFNNRLQEVDGTFRCLPAYRLPPPRQPPPSFADGGVPDLALDGTSTGAERATRIGGSALGRCDTISTVRGYTIVSHGALLSVYNTTEEARLLFSRKSVAAGDDSDCGGTPTPVWSVVSSSASGEALVAEAAHCSAMHMYKVALPYERNSPDMTWMRLPILLVVLLIVAVTHVYSRKAAKATVGRTRRKKREGRRGGDDDDDDDDDDIPMDERLLGRDSDMGAYRMGLGERRAADRPAWERRPSNSVVGSLPRESSRRFGNRWGDDSD